MSFFAELKRRNVFRVAAAYVVLSWLLLQVGDVLFQTLELPASWSKGLLAILVLGLAPALIFSWVYELTPEGVKRESEIDPGNSITAHTARKLDLTVIALLVMAMGLFAYDRMVGEGNGVSVDFEDASVDQGPADSKNDTDPISTASIDTGPSDTSVAVLAFDNMSPDPENAYFAEGISEEILNVLAGIQGLQVASRTSAFSFTGSNTPIPEIARTLDVAHVLEGSVRRQGDRVRITAQLIDARTDKHLWSDTFDRQLDDIFQVQEEIANAIAGALQDALGVTQVEVEIPTRNLQAYELFLRGRQHFFRRGQSMTQGLEDLRAAVERDPQFAEAWALLGATAMAAPGYIVGGPERAEELLAEAEAAAQRALELEPDLALGLAVLAQTGKRQGDPVGAIELLERAVALNPDDSQILMWAGQVRFLATGDRDRSIELLERAYRLDPLVGINNGALGIAYVADGRIEQGRRYIERASELGWPYGIWPLAMSALSRGDRAEAEELVRNRFLNQTSLLIPTNQLWRDLIPKAYGGRISVEEAMATESDFEQEHGPVDLSWLYAGLGEVDKTFDELETHVDLGFFIHRVFFAPGGRVFVEHPRFLEYGERNGLLPAWEDYGYPMGCERVQDELGDHLVCEDWPQ